MRRAACLGLLLGAILRAGAVPQPAYYYPCGVQAGTSNRVVVGGQDLQGVRGAWVSGAGVAVTDIVKVPGFPTQGGGEGEVAWVSKWLDDVWIGRKYKPILPSFKQLRTWRRCSWWDTLDERDPIELSIVARDIYVPKNPLQTSPALAQLLVLTIVARPDAAPGRRDLVLYDGRGAAMPHPFYVSYEPHAAEPLFAPPARRVPDERVFTPPVILDGQVMPGETDSFALKLAKGQHLRCGVVARELLPYIGDAVPGFFNPVLRLADAEGHAVAEADDFYFLPDPVLDCTVPADGTYTLEMHDNLFRGRADFVYAIQCALVQDDAPEPTPQERAFVGFPRPAAFAPPSAPFVRTGEIDCPGRTVTYDLDVSAPGTWDFSLYARRLGSPLEGVVKLFPPADALPPSLVKPLAVWDDVKEKLFVGTVPQVECDPVGTWTFTAPGKYRLVVGDADGAGGAGYGYTLVAGPAEPSFEVYTRASAFLLHANDAAPVTIPVKLVRRNGFDGAVVFDNTADFTCTGSVPRGADEGGIKVQPVRRGEIGMKAVAFTASAAENPTPRTTHVPVTPANEYQQAFAYPHLVPSSAFFFFTDKPVQAVYDLPAWIAMPADRLFPKRVVLPTREFPKKASAAALEAVCDVDTVPVVSTPPAQDDGVLAVKFASSAAHLRHVREVVVREPENGKVNPAVYPWCVLAGVTRFVAGGMRYADGEELRVRMFARSAASRADNDVLVYVPSAETAPLAGSVGAAARRLREAGWCFDFVTDATFPEEPGRSGYRTLYVPKLRKPVPAETLAKWKTAAEKHGWSILCEEPVPGIVAAAKASVRAEPFARAFAAVRFARFSGDEGAWYFLYNPTKRTLSGDWKFSRGGVRTAVAMTVCDGRVEMLKSSADGWHFALKGGEAAWVLLTGRDLTEPQALLPHPGHGGGKACNTCHADPRRRVR